MIKLFNRKKDYIVDIINNNEIEFVEVKAQNKKEAKEMVTDVLLKCPIFEFNSVNDFELRCRRISKFNESIQKMIGFFFCERKKNL